MTGKPCFLVVRTAKNRPKLLLVVREIVRPRRSCRSGRSPEACSGPEMPIDRASLSVGGAHNGLSENLRRCSRRILSGQSDMTGCRPARVGSERTPWRSIGCIDPRGSPAGGAGSGSWRPCLQVTAKEPSQEAPARKSQRRRSEPPVMYIVGKPMGRRARTRVPGRVSRTCAVDSTSLGSRAIRLGRNRASRSVR